MSGGGMGGGYGGLSGGGKGGFGGMGMRGMPYGGFGGMGMRGMPYGGMGGGDPNYFSYPGQRTRELYSRQPSEPPIMSEPFRPPQNELSGVGGSGFSNIPGNLGYRQPTQPTFNAQVVPPGAVGGDLGNPIYSRAPGRGAATPGGYLNDPARAQESTVPSPVGGSGFSNIPGNVKQPTQLAQLTQPTQPAPIGFSGGLSNLGNLRNLLNLKGLDGLGGGLTKPLQQFQQAGTPVEQKGGMPAPFVPSGGYGTERDQYAAPNPGNVSMGLNPLPQDTSAQQAYDQALAQYNSPEYAAYFNSLAPSTRAYMHAPGNQAMGNYLAGQARDSYNAFGRNPWGQ